VQVLVGLETMIKQAVAKRSHAGVSCSIQSATRSKIISGVVMGSQPRKAAEFCAAFPACNDSSTPNLIRGLSLVVSNKP